MNNGKSVRLAALMGALLVAGSLATADDPAGDETRLDRERTQIDETAKGGKDFVPDLSDRFNTDPATVQEMRNAGQGWGEITIQLSLADKLAKTDPTTYPTFGDALTKVRDMRASGMGYGKIANELGFKLGPIVRDVRHVKSDFRRPEGARPQRSHPEGGPGKPHRSNKYK